MSLAPSVREAMLAAVPSLRAFAISLSGNVDRDAFNGSTTGLNNLRLP